MTDEQLQIKSKLKPGDHLLYFDGSSLMDWLIAIKTGARIAHIEIYTGDGMSVASRNGIGVNRYQYRPKGLVCVRRPLWPLDVLAAETWFNNVARGQAYDWKGLLCFYLAVKQGSKDKMFCSEFALNWDRAAGFDPFNSAVVADRTPPSFTWISSQFKTVWLYKVHWTE
jgi:hypothetical protein